MRAELSAFLRLVAKGFLFLLPFAALQLVELFILPIDAFTFRVWEAALAEPFNYPGSFYPDLHVRKQKEFGDRYRSGDPTRIQSKAVEWFTDSYGFRNRPEVGKLDRYDVVITGDSNIVGSFLDQKDILSEVLSRRSGGVAYSYSASSRLISHFMSDPRFKKNPPKLLVVEAKAGNWFLLSDYQAIFHEAPDGNWKIIDLSAEFTKYYDPARNRFLERIHSRLLKQPLFNYLLATLRVDFSVPPKSAETALPGVASGDGSQDNQEQEPGLPLLNWHVENAKLEPLPGEPQPALRFRRTGPACYWQSPRFVAVTQDSSVRLRFEARNSVSPTRHRVYIFEDGIYRSVGEFKAETGWRRYDIPVAAKPGSILEMQIVQNDAAQWLDLRNLRVVGAGPVPVPKSTHAAIPLPLEAWDGGGPCRTEEHCRQWKFGRAGGFVLSPPLPPPGKEGLLLQFEARVDPAVGLPAGCYLAEDARYRAVDFFVFGPRWREYAVVLRPGAHSQNRVQLNLPASAGELSLRSLRVTPLEAPEVRPVAAAPPPPPAAPTPPAGNPTPRPSAPAAGPGEPFPRPPNLAPLNGADRPLSDPELSYYFYRSVKALNREAHRRGMDFILLILPDAFSNRLVPPIRQLRAEGIKIIAYEPQGAWPFGMDEAWFWYRTDSHWTEAAVRLTADEILRLWRGNGTRNRPFSAELGARYDKGFPAELPAD